MLNANSFISCRLAFSLGNVLADKIIVTIIQKTFKVITGPFVVIPGVPPFINVANFLDCARACLNNPLCAGFNFANGLCYIYNGYSQGSHGAVVITIYVKIGSRPQISGLLKRFKVHFNAAY